MFFRGRAMTEAQLTLIGTAMIATALFGAGGAVAWLWQANAYDQVIATNEANHQADLASIANAGAAQARQALAKRQDAPKLVALDKDATEQKERANAENESLRRAVADGTRRLRIAGSCSAGGGNVSSTASAASLADAGSVELSAAGRSVLDIRAGIIADQAALKAAQVYIREACR
jgi:prophage endopeptidase